MFSSKLLDAIIYKANSLLNVYTCQDYTFPNITIDDIDITMLPNVVLLPDFISQSFVDGPPASIGDGNLK